MMEKYMGKYATLDIFPMHHRPDSIENLIIDHN